MYRKQEDKLNLGNILAKIKGQPAVPYTPVIHATSDISAARKVLNKLLQETESCANEVAYIRNIIPQLEEA